MQEAPKISVIMPAFNAGKFIRRAIQSVLDQSFTDYEFIIINDGSTDDTENIINSFKDERIRLFNQENKGVAAALNYGLSVAKADLIARFDADDICNQGRLELQYSLMTLNKSLVITGSSVEYIDEEENYVFTGHPHAYENDSIKQSAVKTCPFIHSSVMYRKSVIVNSGGYNELAHSFEDHLLWVRLIKKGQWLNLPNPLIKVRLNKQSITIDEKWRPAAFRSIKRKALTTCQLSEKDGSILKTIIEKQEVSRIKDGAYYALLAKKYLWNNYQPAKARSNIKKSLTQNPFYTKGYCLWLVSFLPGRTISLLYKKIKQHN